MFILAYVIDVVKAKRGLKNNLYWRGKTESSAKLRVEIDTFFSFVHRGPHKGKV